MGVRKQGSPAPIPPSPLPSGKGEMSEIGDVRALRARTSPISPSYEKIPRIEGFGGFFSLWYGSLTATIFDKGVRHVILCPSLAYAVGLSLGRQLRKVTKSRGYFPTAEAVRKLLFLANRDIIKKWTMPIYNWPSILNQLVTRFDERVSCLCAIRLHTIPDTTPPLIYNSR